MSSWSAPHGGGDAGESTVEHVAVIVLVAAILAAISLLAVDSTVAKGIEAAICRIVSPGKSTCSIPRQGDKAGESPADIWPQWCVSSRDKKTLGVTAHIAFLNFGSDIQIMREDSYEEGLATDPGLNKDGLGHFVYLTFVPKGYSASATAKAGAEVNFAGAKLGTEVSATGGINYHAGDVYRLPAADADTFIQKIKDWESYQADRNTISPFLWVVTRIPGVGPDKPKIPEPFIHFENHDASAALQGTAAVEPLPQLDKTAKYTTGAGLQIEAKADLEREYEHRDFWTNPDGSIDPATATWGTVTGTISGGGNVGAKIGSLDGGWSTKGGLQFMDSVRVFRYDHAGVHNGVPHKAGDLQGVRFKLTTWSKSGNSLNGSSGDGGGKKVTGGAGQESYTTTTRSLEVDTNSPESRAIAEDWLRKNYVHLKFPDFVYDEMLDGKIKDPGPGADPFDKLFYDTGMGWREHADTNVLDNSFGFDISGGPGLGIQVNNSHLTLETKKAEILGHPVSGERSYIDFPQCTAAVNH